MGSQETGTPGDWCPMEGHPGDTSDCVLEPPAGQRLGQTPTARPQVTLWVGFPLSLLMLALPHPFPSLHCCPSPSCPSRQFNPLPPRCLPGHPSPPHTVASGCAPPGAWVAISTSPAKSSAQGMQSDPLPPAGWQGQGEDYSPGRRKPLQGCLRVPQPRKAGSGRWGRCH